MNKNKRRWNRYSPDYQNITEIKVKEKALLLDFLLQNLQGLSRNNIKNLLKNHQVAVDGAPITQFDFVLSKDDIVIVSRTRIRKRSEVKLPLVYEDDEIIVINKPAGLLSIASDKEKGKTAYRMLMDYVQSQNKHHRIYVVHRLDRETSGILLMVKNEVLRDALQNNWNELVQKRGYYAIVEGVMKEKEKEIISYLKVNSVNLMFVCGAKEGGKKAITRYRVLKENKQYSLLDVQIDTGRKNQIRVQLGHLWHNVIGDDKYGDPANPLQRLGLHAYELSLRHPFSNKLLSFTSKIPAEFLALF